MGVRGGHPGTAACFDRQLDRHGEQEAGEEDPGGSGGDSDSQGNGGNRGRGRGDADDQGGSGIDDSALAVCTGTLLRARVILDDVAEAAAAVRRIADGAAGTVRVGITPPAAPVLTPYLSASFQEQNPGVVVDVQRMWLPTLATAVADGTLDVAITCGLVPGGDGVLSEAFCAEPLLIGLRAGHRLADADPLRLADLAHHALGATSAGLFPAWALAQQQALTAARVVPSTVPLEATDLNAAHWTEQSAVDWILLIASLGHGHAHPVLREPEPRQLVPFTLQWNPDRAQTDAVAKFVEHALTVPPPPGWYTQPGHTQHQEPG